MAGGSEAIGHAFLDLLWCWAIAFISLIGVPIRMPPLLFYLIFGAVIGNTGLFYDGEGIQFFAEFSITVVFFSLGFEETVEHFIAGIRKAWGIASIGAFVPFGCGYLVAWIFWADQGWKVHLALATAVTATAVSLTMVVLQSVGLTKVRAATGIMTSAVLDDVGCLILVAILTPIVAGKATPSALGITWMIGKVIIFFVIIVIFHNFILPHDVKKGWLSKIPFFRTYGIKHIFQFQGGDQVSLMVVVWGLGVGMIGWAFGFHPTVGAYFAGLILDESYFDVTVKGRIINTMEKAKDIVGSASFMWLGPVFFVHLGATLKVEVDLLASGIPQALAICGILFVGQLSSATLAARFVPGGFSWTESGLIGLGMLGRAELYFVVLTVVKREGVIGNEIFFPMAVAAMLLNILLPVTISLYKPLYIKYHPLTEEEQEPASPEATSDEPPPPPSRRASQLTRRGIGLRSVEHDYAAHPWWMDAGNHPDLPPEQSQAPPKRTRSALSFFDRRDSFREPVRSDSFVEPRRNDSFNEPGIHRVSSFGTDPRGPHEMTPQATSATPQANPAEDHNGTNGDENNSSSRQRESNVFARRRNNGTSGNEPTA